MTAPLAWLYGIPYERFLSEADAAQMNVWTLELVSLWRVLLISRVVSVLTPCSFFAGFTKVSVPAFSLLYVALFYARMPLVNWMGGVNVPPGVAPVASAYMSITLFGPFVILIGGIGWLVSLFVEDAAATLEGFRIQWTGEIGRALPILGSAVILAFTAVLPFTQREQQLRYEVETDLKNNQVEKALTMLAAHDRKEFPPQWTPPPWPEYGDGERSPSLVDVVKALKTRSDVPEWVQSIYQEKAKLYVSNERPAGTAFGVARDSILTKYAEAGAVPCPDARRDLSPGQGWAFWIVFRSASCADFVVETSIGPELCGGNPTTEMQTWKGSVSTAQRTRPAQHDRVCYRTRSVDSNQWSQWQVLTRHVSPKDSVETYEVMLP